MLILVVVLSLAAGISDKFRHYVKNQSIEWKIGATIGAIAILVLIALRIFTPS